MRHRRTWQLGWALIALAHIGCSVGIMDESDGGRGGGSDALHLDAIADGGLADAVVGDGASPDGAVVDAMCDAPFDAEAVDAEPADAESGLIAANVEIYIDNFCNTSAAPESFTVPADSTLQLTYHNTSVDYAADVWLSYGGGYLGLVTGGTWADSFEFCVGSTPYTAYADISIAGGGGATCPQFRLYIYCQ